MVDPPEVTWPEVAWPEEALFGSTIYACTTGSCAISALVRPFDRKLATGSAFPRFFLSSSTKCWLGMFSTTSTSYNLIIFYELALLLVICPFPAILFWNIIKSNSSTVWFNFHTYIIFSINLVSFKVTLRSSGTDILYGCHLLLDVCIIYFITCDCIVNFSLSYTIY